MEQDTRRAGAEIEVTEAMVDSGNHVLCSYVDRNLCNLERKIVT